MREIDEEIKRGEITELTGRAVIAMFQDIQRRQKKLDSLFYINNSWLRLMLQNLGHEVDIRWNKDGTYKYTIRHRGDSDE